MKKYTIPEFFALLAAVGLNTAIGDAKALVVNEDDSGVTIVTELTGDPLPDGAVLIGAWRENGDVGLVFDDDVSDEFLTAFNRTKFLKSGVIDSAFEPAEDGRTILLPLGFRGWRYSWRDSGRACVYRHGNAEPNMLDLSDATTFTLLFGDNGPYFGGLNANNALVEVAC